MPAFEGAVGPFGSTCERRARRQFAPLRLKEGGSGVAAARLTPGRRSTARWKVAAASACRPL